MKIWIALSFVFVCSACANGFDELHIAKSRYLAGDYSSISTIEIYANKQNPEAQFILAEAYFWGKGVDENNGQSRRWYLISAENGFPESQYIIGVHLLQGSFGLEKSPQKAHSMLIKSANKGHELSICGLINFPKEYDVKREKWIEIAESKNICGFHTD